MSKKLVLVRVIIILVVALLISLFVYIVVSVKKHIDIKEDISVETIIKKEENIIFDLTKSPKGQRKKIINHTKEYIDQLYSFIFEDKKFANCLGYNYLSVYDIVDNFNSTESLAYLLNGAVMPSLMEKLFLNNEKDFRTILDDIPVTENYKQKHPKPLYEEFDFIKKNSYKSDKQYYNEYMNFDYWYEFDYDYYVGVDEKKEIVCVGEDKYASLVYKDRESGEEGSGIVRDKEGNEAPAYIETRNFYFKYTLDEKGYVDDIVYDRTEIINDDKYIDNLIKYE